MVSYLNRRSHILLDISLDDPLPSTVTTSDVVPSPITC
jgi:hypothetical protein